ncbi:MAG TPA: DUF6754 domain-containing protein [Anaerolineales bacterium]
MTGWVGLGALLFSTVLLIAIARLRRPSAARFRPISGLTSLYRAFGHSVEGGTRLIIALGGPSLLSRSAGPALAGLRLLKEIAQRGTGSDLPPLAVSGEPSLALLSQDTLHAGYRAIGAPEFFQPVTGRVAGLTPFSSSAATMPMISDEQASVAALIGHFGVESALLAEAAERSNVVLIGATDDPAAQAVLYATSTDPLVGEELFAAPAYFAGGAMPLASLTVQDVLRWIIIAVVLLGAALKLLQII